MKKYRVSLESAFLSRHFRSIRVALVGKRVERTFTLAQRAMYLSPTKFPPKTNPAHIIFERKRALRNIDTPIDIDSGTAIDLKPTPSSPTQPSATVAKSNKRGKVKAFLFGGIIITCIALLVGLFAPTVYYTLFPGDAIPIETDASGTPLGGNFSSGSARVSSTVASPKYDANLPDGNWLMIPKIGVKTEILESATPDESLNKGVWRVPDFGTPTDLSKPMILAAHRYGWKAWWANGNQYWRYHSFYLLPKLEQGDIIQVISDHKKYVYEVYAGEQGEEISDYNADLILYTCKFLDSPLRYFRYARLVDPNNPAALSSK